MFVEVWMSSRIWILVSVNYVSLTLYVLNCRSLYVSVSFFHVVEIDIGYWIVDVVLVLLFIEYRS